MDVNVIGLVSQKQAVAINPGGSWQCGLPTPIIP